jgi:hypothetical protein
MFHHHKIIASASLGLALMVSANMAHAENANYFARWTVSDNKPAYSAKGKLYKTIDVAPCGNDFCGVAVDDKNKCGQTLFRFFTIHARDEELVGHGVWGKLKKKLVIDYATPNGEKPFMQLGLGEDDMDVTGRDGSIPTFQANYKNIGKATCSAR